jgi:hypothetical protein
LGPQRLSTPSRQKKQEGSANEIHSLEPYPLVMDVHRLRQDRSCSGKVQVTRFRATQIALRQRLACRTDYLRASLGAQGTFFGRGRLPPSRTKRTTASTCFFSSEASAATSDQVQLVVECSSAAGVTFDPHSGRTRGRRVSSGSRRPACAVGSVDSVWPCIRGSWTRAVCQLKLEEAIRRTLKVAVLVLEAKGIGHARRGGDALVNRTTPCDLRRA